MHLLVDISLLLAFDLDIMLKNLNKYSYKKLYQAII